jgi:hypothetical protein
MFDIDKLNRDAEIKANRMWKALTPSQKHMALMFMYRCETDVENIHLYLETYRFHQMGICMSEFPKFVCQMTPEELYREAYEVLGKRAPVNKRQPEASP